MTSVGVYEAMPVRILVVLGLSIALWIVIMYNPQDKKISYKKPTFAVAPSTLPRAVLTNCSNPGVCAANAFRQALDTEKGLILFQYGR